MFFLVSEDGEEGDVEVHKGWLWGAVVVGEEGEAVGHFGGGGARGACHREWVRAAHLEMITSEEVIDNNILLDNNKQHSRTWFT